MCLSRGAHLSMLSTRLWYESVEFLGLVHFWDNILQGLKVGSNKNLGLFFSFQVPAFLMSRQCTYVVRNPAKFSLESLTYKDKFIKISQHEHLFLLTILNQCTLLCRVFSMPIILHTIVKCSFLKVFPSWSCYSRKSQDLKYTFRRNVLR